MALTEKTKAWIQKNADVDLIGKTVLITGANSGIGFKTMETMAYLGASVVMACRKMEKALTAKEKLLADYPHADIRILKLDLSSFSSIDIFA